MKLVNIILVIIIIIIGFITINNYFKNIERFENDENLTIPKKIYQTHKSEEYVKNDPKLSEAANSWKNTGYEYNFYNNEQCEEFVKNNFDKNVYNAYIKCPKPVMKADLWRYCVIYINGGIYADADTKLVGNIDDISSKKALLVGVPENSTHFCQWVFAAPPKSPILLEIINKVTNKINTADKPINAENYTEHYIHGFTGPAIFSEAIDDYLKKQNLEVYPNDKNEYVGKYNDILYMFDADNFHKNIVNHMFYGSSTSDGWTKTR